MAILSDCIHEFYRNNIEKITIDAFVRKFFCVKENSHTYINFGREAYNQHYKNDYIDGILGMPLIEEHDRLLKYYQESLYEDFRSKLNKDFSEWFITLIKGLEKYYINEKSRDERLNGKHVNMALRSDPFTAKQLMTFYQTLIDSSAAQNCDSITFACSIYSLLVYLYKGYLPQLFFEKVNGLEPDKEEFIEEVIKKYGCSGNPGKSRIYQLANRKNKEPNSIALYELAELEYYGNGFSNEPNYVAAYYYYSVAVDLKHYNPLAGWSLGYMIYNYNNPKNPLYKVTINELEYLTPKHRLYLAVHHLKRAYSCGCPAAANVLANILTDNNISDEDKEYIKSTFKLKEPLSYYEEASNYNYAFAKNNLYQYYYNKSLDPNQESERQVNIEKAFELLKQSADLGDPYAANKYAKYYLIKNKGDFEEALQYFYISALQSESFAAFNILEYYYFSKERRTMLFSLPMIKDSTERLNDFIDRLMYVCKKSTDEKILNKYYEWSKKLQK